MVKIYRVEKVYTCYKHIEQHKSMLNTNLYWLYFYDVFS